MAKYSVGVLELTLPKKPGTAAKKITVPQIHRRRPAIPLASSMATAQQIEKAVS